MDTVVLVTADSLRYDHFSYAGEVEGTTPFLDSLAADGVFFENAVATGSGTSSSFPGILASALPMEYGYRGLNEKHRPVAKQLREHRIRTVGVTASTHVSTLYGYDRGFETFYQNPDIRGGADARSLKERGFDVARQIPVVRTVGRQVLRSARSVKRDVSGIDRPYELAKRMTDVALDRIKYAADRSADRLFVWIHYMEPHSPPYPPETYVEQFHDGGYSRTEMYELWQRWRRNRPPLWDNNANMDATSILTDEEVEAMREFYRAQVLFLDDELRRFWEGLAEVGVRETTTLLFTADHGEEFFEHGDLAHRQKLYDELVHVPLVAYHGGDAFADNEDVRTPVSLVDLGPTVADLLNVDAHERWQGISFAPVFAGGEHDREYAISELCHRGHDEGYGGDVQQEKAVVSVRTADWKYIRNRQKGARELYDLAVDPGETTNVYDDNPEVAAELEGIATERLESVTGRRVADIDVSEDVKERLADLGYSEE